MHSERPLSSRERFFLVLFLGSLPAVFVASYLGLFAAGIGSPADLVSVALRALVCAAPLVLLAYLAPRGGLPLSIPYGWAFYCGYTSLDSLGAVTNVLLAPLAALAGHRMGMPTGSAHPELVWIFVFSLSTAACVSFLRRSRDRSGGSHTPAV